MANFNKVLLIGLYDRQKLSIPDISKHLNIPQSTVRYQIIKSGVKLRSHKEAAANYKGWGNWIKGKKLKPFTKQHRDRISQARLSMNWKGISLKPNGYFEVTRGENKGRLLHRVVIEEHIGRKLKPTEIVHHKNENKTDNRIDNLQVMTRSEHTKMHRLNRRQIA